MTARRILIVDDDQHLAEMVGLVLIEVKFMRVDRTGIAQLSLNARY